MLWSDRTREIPPEVRRAQTMLRRAGLLMAVAAAVALLLLLGNTGG